MKNLKKIVRTDAAFDILDSSNCAGSDWGAGGCAILAQALNKLEGYPMVVIYNLDYDAPEHFGVITPSGTILDHDGEHNNSKTWLNFFVKNEHPREGALTIRYFTPDMDMNGIKFDSEASDKLAELIKTHSIIRETVRGVLKESIKEAFDKDYKSWKRKNVTIRGVQEVGQENNAGAMLGRGLYSAALSNKDLAKQYGKVYFVVGAIPKNPKVFNNLNEWEIWFYNTLVYKYSKEKGKEFPDKRDFNAVTTIEDEMQKLGYDGIVIKGREMVNFTPGDVLYFENDNQLSNYYDYNIKLNETDGVLEENPQEVRRIIRDVLKKDFIISESNLRIDEALAFINQNFLNESDEPSPTFEWDFVKSKIDDSKRYVRTDEQAYEYLIRLLEKIKSLPKSIKIRIAKYVALSLIGLLGYNAVKSAVYEYAPEINKEINMAIASHEQNSNETESSVLKFEPRKSSESLVDILKHEEGSVKEKGEPVLKAYKLGDGMITVGWGHAERINKSKFKPGQEITREKAEELLAADIAEAERGLNKILDDWKENNINVEISQSMYDAMTSMIFNMGIGNFRKSEFIQLVKQGKYDEAAERILTTNVTYPGHVFRRQKESDLFSKDIQSESFMLKEYSEHGDESFLDWLSMKLRKDIGDRIGGGQTGEVFKMGHLVIKISKNEMFDSTAVMNKNISGIAKTYAHGKINVPVKFLKKGFGGNYVDFGASAIGVDKSGVLYYLIMEKVNTSSKIENEVDDVRWAFEEFLKSEGKDDGLPALRILFEEKENMQLLWKFVDYIKEEIPNPKAVIETLAEVLVVLRNVGEHYDWMDIHAAQFGRNSKGELVAFDLDNPHNNTEDFIKNTINESSDSEVYTKEIDSSYNDEVYKLIGNQFPSYGTATIGLFDGDKLIGAILLEEDYLPWDYRFDIIINKRYRNKGYSSVLIRALIDKFNKDPEAEQISAIVINNKLMRVLEKFDFYEDEFDGMRMAFLNKKSIKEDIELKDVGDDDGYWDRVKIIAKNKKGEEVGYAILDMGMHPESEFGYMDDNDPAKFSDEDIEQHFPEDFAAKLEHIEVYSKFRESGFGKELMDAVIKYVKSRDYKTLYLIASPIGFEPRISLDALSKFYSGYGFEVVKDFGNAHDMVAQLRENNIEESALRQKDLPESTALFIREINQGYDFVLYNPKEKSIYATITIVSRDYYGKDFYYVTAVVAEKGFGPFIYELAMMHIFQEKKGLMPQRDGDVREKAFGVWEKFYKRSDIKKKVLNLLDNSFRCDILYGNECEFEDDEDKMSWWMDLSETEKESLNVFNSIYYMNPDSQYYELKEKGNKYINNGLDIQKVIDSASDFFDNAYMS